MMDESNVPAAVDEALSERSDGDEPATATEQARRRRRRGGRGRGRGRGTRTPSESSGEDLSVSEEVSRDEEAAEPEQIEAVLAPAEVADGEGDSQAPPQ